jgi:hypothetical protein
VLLPPPWHAGNAANEKSESRRRRSFNRMGVTLARGLERG